MAAKENKIKTTVGFVALGCPKNMVDSERMLAQIAQAGFIITQDADNADVVVINTCGFIAPAKAEALAAIRKAVGQKRKEKVRKVIVAGCLPQRLGKELLEETGKIDAIVTLEHRDNIAEIISRTLAADAPVHFITPTYESLCDDRVRLRITPPHYAYLRISEGCSRKCSFCTIPAIRGKHRSKPARLIIAEVEELVASGTVELNIIGQDITAYGRDLGTQQNLPNLLTELAKIPRLRWIRLLYLYPSGINDRLIEAVARSEKIVPYFDIPIQHINSQILSRMRRPHSKDRICRLLEKLRNRLPGCVIRTTLIVGFPGETETRFNELLEFVKWAGFDHLGCFTFYPEKGTPAAKFPHQIPERVKKQRLDKIMRTQQRLVFEKNKTRIGNVLTCIIDSTEKNRTAKGRFFGQAPQIDPLCIIKNCSACPGAFIDSKIIGTRGYDLLCEQI